MSPRLLAALGAIPATVAAVTTLNHPTAAIVAATIAAAVYARAALTGSNTPKETRP